MIMKPAGFVHEAVVRHWEEAPVAFPCGVVDLPAALHFAIEVLEVEIAKGQRIATERALGMYAISFGKHERMLAMDGEQVGEQVFRLGESGRLDERRIVRRIPGRHDHRMPAEATDEHSAFMVRGWIHRAAHSVEAFAAEPCFGGAQQRVRDVLIVRAFKEPEKADLVGMKLVMCAVLDGGDPADWLSVAEGEKQASLRLAVEGVRLGVERVTYRDAKRRSPLRVFRTIVDLPWEIDKPAQVARGLDGDDLD
jgi:hypothetical protein